MRLLRFHRFDVRVVALVGLWALTGCTGLSYVLHLAEGQLQVQGHVRPIDDVLAAGQLSDEDAAKLRLIVQARDYAGQTMGLTVGRSYTTFYDTGQDPQAWNLSAARKDALVPKTWTFPVMGEVPYLAFFNEKYMHAVEQQLLDEGYDTMTYELDAYSTLGIFDDPVRSAMLQRDVISLSETVIHELLHNTVYSANNTSFNESLATFVGRQGAVEFLRTEYGPDSELPSVAIAFYADTDAVNTFLMQLYANLQDYYAQPLSRAEKIAGREAVFQVGRDQFAADVQPTLHYPGVFVNYANFPTSNAWMLINYRYNLDLDVFAAVYAATDHDWAAALDVYRAAAAASGDPFDYLRNWVAAHQ